MYRYAMKDLMLWKDKSDRKPLIINGARQVGKTWIMKKFGEDHFDSVLYVNFERHAKYHQLFDDTLDPHEIIGFFEIEFDMEISSEKTLIIFDEIQECKRALTSLKYFCEEAPEYAVISAGSLLGVSLNEKVSFPVGKVEFLALYPLNFNEFLDAIGESKLNEQLIQGNQSMIMRFSSRYKTLLKYYYYVGGMPEVVDHYAKHKDLRAIRDVQMRILEAYERDFSKYVTGNTVQHLHILWTNIPSQLSKENKKFVYNQIRSGARAKDYEKALYWLVNSGLIHKVHRLKVPELPLEAFVELSAFKLYILDIGLLSAKVGLEAKTIIDGNEVFKTFKGALTEQYVLQQLLSNGHKKLHYWTSDKGIAEIDYVINIADTIVPLEVKAEENLKAKSLKSYLSKYSPSISVRTSMANYRDEGWLINIPLYQIGQMNKIVLKKINQ